MENGECMRQFLKYINKKADLKETIENSYELRNTFRESIKLINKKEICPLFSCELKSESKKISSIKSLDNVLVKFSPLTPLDICFGEASIQDYQRLFTRILQIKRALHCARNLK